jgi:magnesium chelatase accessory protein
VRGPAAEAASAAGRSFVDADGLRWCVQRAGQGARTLLMLHGTGASLHSFDALLPLLQDDFLCLVPDLPGHGDSGRPRREQLTMSGMGRALAALLQVLKLQPDIVVGHSAGAALAVRMALDGLIAPRCIVAINGAFLPFGGPVAPLLSPLARLLYAQRWVPHLFARRAADAAVVRRLIEGTGSRLDAAGIQAYQRLMQRPGHAEAALGMMAHWDLPQLAHDLPRLQTPLHLLVGALDRAVPPAQAQRVVRLCPLADVTLLPGVGHLAHEEAPQAVARYLHALSSTGGRVTGPRV